MIIQERLHSLKAQWGNNYYSSSLKKLRNEKASHLVARHSLSQLILCFSKEGPCSEHSDSCYLVLLCLPKAYGMLFVQLYVAINNCYVAEII